jgi:hypothetical protein
MEYGIYIYMSIYNIIKVVSEVERLKLNIQKKECQFGVNKVSLMSNHQVQWLYSVVVHDTCVALMECYCCPLLVIIGIILCGIQDML